MKTRVCLKYFVQFFGTNSRNGPLKFDLFDNLSSSKAFNTVLT